MVFWKLIVFDRRWWSVCGSSFLLFFYHDEQNSSKIEKDTRDFPLIKKPPVPHHVKSGEKKDRKASNKNAWTVTLAAQQKMHGLYWKRYTLFLFFFAIKIVLSTTPNPPPCLKIKIKIDLSSLTFIFCLSLACRSQPCQHETAHFCLFHLCWHLAWVPIQLQRYFHDNVYSGRSESV